MGMRRRVVCGVGKVVTGTSGLLDTSAVQGPIRLAIDVSAVTDTV